MNKLILFWIGCLIATCLELKPQDWPCTREEAGSQFLQKTLVSANPMLDQDPYQHQSAEQSKIINDYLNNHEMVCGYRYIDSEKIKYELKTFSSKQEAEQQGFRVTHQGRCGACSSFQDLAVYLLVDLTDPIADCGMKGFWSQKAQIKCIMKTGFTEACSQIWAFDTNNTRRECMWTCIWWQKIRHAPYIMPDGSLNPCIQCDEDKSGPIFKYFAARTRRDSGIKSEIDRPQDQVYDMDQCYY